MIATTPLRGRSKSSDLSFFRQDTKCHSADFQVVNIGNIYSRLCADFVNPFVRYVRARVAGRDMHEMLGGEGRESDDC